MAFSTHEQHQPPRFSRDELLRAGGMLGVCLLLLLIFQASLPSPRSRDMGPQLTADSATRKQDATPEPLHAGVELGSSERIGSSPRAGGRQHSNAEAAELLHRLQQLEGVVAALSSKVDALEVDRRNTAKLLDRVLQ